MAELTVVCEGLAESLGSIEGLQESPHWLAKPTPPCAEIVPGPSEDQTFGGGHDGRTFIVRVMVGLTSDKGAQKLLNRMLEPAGEDSVQAALLADTTLGDRVGNLNVGGDSGYRIYRREGAGSVLGAEWRVDVLF